MPVKLNHTPEMLDSNTLEVFRRMRTQEWRHTVRFRDRMKAADTIEEASELCRIVQTELLRVSAREKELTDSKAGEREHFTEKLEELAEYFGDLIDVSETDKEEHQRNFNYGLSELYDLGDAKIILADDTLQKFLWIG